MMKIGSPWQDLNVELDGEAELHRCRHHGGMIVTIFELTPNS